MKTLTVEQLASNFANEFFDRRFDAELLEAVTSYHREALADYFENFARSLLLADPDGIMEIDVASFISEGGE